MTDPHRTEYDAVIFDCDGVLADTDDAWERAEAGLAAAYGLAFDAEIRARTHGLTPRDSVEVMAAGRTGLPAERLAAELMDRAGRELAVATGPLPGARELVARLVARGVPVAVASNTPRRLLDVVLAAIGVSDLVNAVVASDEVAAPKPAPDLYLEAARRLGVAPSRALVFEDSPTGVRAALAAGCQVIGVVRPGRPPLHGIRGSVPDLSAVPA